MRRYKLPASLFVVAVFYVWLVFAATTPNLPSPENPFVFYSNQQKQDLKLTLCQAIKEAKHSIFLQMYAITDPDILKLLKKTEARGISPKILYDKTASINLKTLPGATPHRGKGLMHRKILVIDHSLVFLGSANMTTQSLRLHDNLLFGLYHPELADFLEHTPSTEPYKFSIQDQPCELWLLPDTKETALDKFLEILNKATKKIHIAVFTITHPRIADALIQAKKRGVSVKIAVDFFTERGASHAAIQKLHAAGIPIYCSQGMQLLHHKWTLIDGTTLIAGSANWTKAAFTSNQDFFLILSQLTPSQKKIHETALENNST